MRPVIPHVAQNKSGRSSAVPEAIRKVKATRYRNERESSSSKALAGPRRWVA